MTDWIKIKNTRAAQALELVQDLRRQGLTDQDFQWRFRPQTQWDLYQDLPPQPSSLEILFQDPRRLTWFRLKYSKEIGDETG